MRWVAAWASAAAGDSRQQASSASDSEHERAAEAQAQQDRTILHLSSDPNSAPPVSNSARFLNAIRNRNAVSSPSSASGVNRCSKPTARIEAGVRIDQPAWLAMVSVGAEVAPGLAADRDLLGELDAHARR